MKKMDQSLSLKITKIFLDLMEEWKNKEEGNTQEKLGRMTGVHPTSIPQFRKKRKALVLSHLIEVADILDVPVEIFFLGDPTLTPKQNRQIVERLLEQRRLLVKDILT